MNPLMTFSGFSWGFSQTKLPEAVSNAYIKLTEIQQAEVMKAYADDVIKRYRRKLPDIGVHGWFRI